MFTSSRQLLGTPSTNQRSNRQHGTKGLEFTPIGGARSVSNNPTLLNNLASRSTNIPGNGSPTARSFESPLHKHNLTGSSFDNYDVNDDSLNDVNLGGGRHGINEGRIFRGADILPDYSDDETNYNQYDLNNNNDNNDNFFEHENNPLKLQSNQVKYLQSDNLNLRIELRTLKKYLDGQPKDKTELINRNVSLTQENHNLQQMIMALKEQLALSKSSQSQPNSPNRELREKLTQYEEHLKESEYQIHDLKEDLITISDAKDQLFVDKENLEFENDNLKSEIEKLTNKIEAHHNESIDNEDEIDDLRLELSQVTNQRDELQETIDDYKIKISKLENHLEDKKELENEEIDKINDMVNDYKSELEAKEAELEELKSKNSDLFNAVDDLKSENDGLIKKLSALTSKNDDLMYGLNHMKLNNNNTSNSLTDEIEFHIREKSKLSNEIKMLKSDHDDYVNTIRDLKKTIKELQGRPSPIIANDNVKAVDESYINDIEADRGELYDSLMELNNRLKKSDYKINLLTDELHDKESTIEHLKNKLSIESRDKEATINKLKNNQSKDIESSKSNSSKDLLIEKLNSQIFELQDKLLNERNKSIDEINHLDNKYLSERDELLKKVNDLEISKIELVEDYEKIQLKCHDLINELNNSKENSDLENDFKLLSIDYKQTLNDLAHQQEKNELLINNLNQEILYKDSEIDKLLSTIHSLSMNDSTKHDQQLKEKTNLLNDKLDLEDKLKYAIRENNQLRNQISLLKSNDLSTENDKIKFIENELKSVNNEKDELFKSLSKTKKEYNELKWKLEDYNLERNDLLKDVKVLDAEQDKLNKENKKLTRELKTLKDNISNSSLNSNSSVSKDAESLLVKLELKDNALKKLAKDYDLMKNDLLNRYESLREQKIVLNNQVEQLNEQLEKSKIIQAGLISQQQKEQTYPMTPRTPNSSSSSSSLDEGIENKLVILQSQKKLFKLKLQQYKDLNNDLKFTVEFLTKDLKVKDSIVNSNINILEKSSSNEYNGFGKSGYSNKFQTSDKLSFKSIALTVLASVRFKNRLNELKLKKQEEISLKKSIIINQMKR